MFKLRKQQKSFYTISMENFWLKLKGIHFHSILLIIYNTITLNESSWETPLKLM